jgi:ubiquitin
MKTCDFCGNPVAEHLKLCPYCNHAFLFAKQEQKFIKKGVEIINLEAGMPFVKEALERFDSAFSSAQNKSIGLLKIIHGYGSSGKGGKIKIALQQKLKLMYSNQLIKSIIKGEVFSKSTNSKVHHKKLIDCYPELLETIRADTYNLGITLVEI